jgi:hypothetical protein
MKSEHPPLNPNLAYAIKIVHATCCLAGSKSYLDDIRADLGQCGVIRAARDHDTAAIFDWLGGSAPHLPQNWRDIGVGDLVVTHEGPEEGWYEAIVVEAASDMLTLRWRDYPRERRVVRHRLRLGLLYPRAKLTAESGKSAKALVQAKHDKAVAANRAANAQSLPKDWDDIDIGHLVLAKAESRWPAWWEAIVVENADDLFKLRWRDNASLRQSRGHGSTWHCSVPTPLPESTVDRSGPQQVRTCPWPADQISAEQAAARGASPTQTIFPFCPAATVVALETRRCFTAGPHHFRRPR